MIELDLLVLVVMLAAGFFSTLGYRAWQAREQSSFRPLLPPVSRTPRSPARRQLPGTGAHHTADDGFLPLAPQTQHEPGAPCFVCGKALDEGGHENC